MYTSSIDGLLGVPPRRLYRRIQAQVGPVDTCLPYPVFPWGIISIEVLYVRLYLDPNTGMYEPFSEAFE